MNRRDFTRGLAALSLAPALPLPAIGKTATVATASADKLYFVGWYTAKLNKTCSPAVLASELNVDPSIAREIFTKLVKNNTVSAPNALGVSQTINPLGDTVRRANGQAMTRVLNEQSKTVKKRVLDTVEEQIKTSDDETVDTSNAEEDLTNPDELDTLEDDQT